MPKDVGSRAIPIHDHLADILRAYRRNEGYVLRAHTQFKGERVGTKRVYRYDPKKIWLRVLEKTTAAGLKPITPHGMRHTFASNLLKDGVSDELVSRWLGHADTSMVHQTYGHLRSWHGDINRMTFNGTPLNKGLPQGSE